MNIINEYQTKKQIQSPHILRMQRDEQNEEEEEGGDNKYDGVAAAQQREFNMTKDPATNTLPKDRLFTALQKRNELIQQQKQQLILVVIIMILKLKLL